VLGQVLDAERPSPTCPHRPRRWLIECLDDKTKWPRQGLHDVREVVRSLCLTVLYSLVLLKGDSNLLRRDQQFQYPCWDLIEDAEQLEILYMCAFFTYVDFEQ